MPTTRSQQADDEPLRSLAAAAAHTAKQRDTAAALLESLKAEGWDVINPRTHSLELRDDLSSPPLIGASSIHLTSGPRRIFEQMFPPDLIMEIMKSRSEADPMALHRDHGHGYSSKMKITEKAVFDYIALRIHITTCMENRPKSMHKTFILAARELKEKHSNSFTGVHCLRAVHRLLYIRLGTSEEARLTDAARSTISSFGKAVAGDEKLFRYTGKHSWVRQVITKPAKVGIWHYQSVCLLPPNLPFLFYSRAHTTIKKDGEQTTTASVIKDWMNATKNAPLPATDKPIIVMDSYYLSADGRKLALERSHPIIAAVKSDRFPNIVKYASKRVTQAGERMFFHNKTTNESIAYVWSLDSAVGRKIVYSNCFNLKTSPTAKNTIPIYDTYKTLFGWCDYFNKALCGRSWPFRSGGHGRSGADGNSFDYLFTCVMVNSYHTYLSINGKQPSSESYKAFCNALVTSLINKYK